MATGAGRAERGVELVGERLPFAMLPRWLLYHPDVSEGAKFLYCVLHDLVAGRQGATRPVSRAELAAACAVSVDTIDRRLSQLVTVGAVEKQPQTKAGGQQANVYIVWLTPPGGLHRDAPETVDNRGRKTAAPVEGSANAQVNRSRESAAPPSVTPAGPHPGGTRSRTDAAPKKKEERQEEDPPQPPRPAGGPAESGRSSSATAPPFGRRAAGTNHRAETERAEAERLQAEAAARAAELEARTAARRAAELAAEREAERLEFEARCIAAALDDELLAAVVGHVVAGLSGLLAGSAVAVTRAVVAWCRTAADRYPGPLADAVAAALADRLLVAEGSPPLTLSAAPVGTPTLRSRVAPLLHKSAEVD